MIDTLTSENHRDFVARYQGTVGWYLGDKDKKILVNVARVHDNRVMFKDVAGVEYFANANSDIKFEFIPVDRGFFNAKGGLVYMERIPARQWHRGICSNNTKMWACNPGFAEGFLPCGVNVATLHNVFVEGPPVSRRWVEHRIDPKKYSSVALSKHFAFIGEKFYFCRTQVGTYRDNKIKLDNDLVFQEVCDVVKRNNLQVEVTK
jgi:hypothetical protein